MEPEPMPDPSSEDFIPEQSLAPLQSEDLEARQERLQREIEKAGRQAKQLAYAQLRDQVRIERGAPSEPGRGTGDCLAVVLLPIGLVLMLVHPAPAIAVWAMAGALYLAGSDHQKRDRAAIRAADEETERRWQRLQRQSSEEEEIFTTAFRSPEPPQSGGYEPPHRD
jgi:hypothetical protein